MTACELGAAESQWPHSRRSFPCCVELTLQRQAIGHGFLGYKAADGVGPMGRRQIRFRGHSREGARNMVGECIINHCPR